jgi:hypothetical protein
LAHTLQNSLYYNLKRDAADVPFPHPLDIARRENETGHAHKIEESLDVVEVVVEANSHGTPENG